MSNSKTVVVQKGGIGFMGALFLIFLVLKLTHVIDWSWWWVTAPLWGPLVVCVSIFLIAFVILISAAILTGIAEEYNKRKRV